MTCSEVMAEPNMHLQEVQEDQTSAASTFNAAAYTELEVL